MSKQEAWMEISMGGNAIVVEKSIALKLFEILTSGEGVYRRQYDWSDKMHWVDVVDPEQVSLKYIPAGEFAVMKIVGANKEVERRAKETAEREERERKVS
jgi:hypothetical protein